LAWTSQIPAAPRSDRWWHDRRVYELEATVRDARARRIERRRARVAALDTALAHTELAASMSAARRGMPPGRRAQFDAGLEASMRDAGIELRGRRLPRGGDELDEFEHFVRVGRILSVR
jgi:hypothetical protein